MPTSARTASNDVVNCPARFRTRNRKSAARSPRSISRLRICCTVHGPSGFAVTPRTCTQRLPTSMTNRQYRHWRVTAQSTWKWSAASIVDAWGELAPRRVSMPFRRRRNLQGLENPAERRCADLVAELYQLTLAPLVPPAVVLDGEPLDP